jgi:hypothetical protein
VRFWLGVFTTLLVVAPTADTIVVYETMVVEVEREQEWVDTPIADNLVRDWDEVYRQSDCLFTYLQQHLGYDITLEAVLFAGAWLDILGGPCYVIGEDDEEQG